MFIINIEDGDREKFINILDKAQGENKNERHIKQMERFKQMTTEEQCKWLMLMDLI